jgi:hypothetical protein
MAKLEASTKRLAITKANAQMLSVAVVAAFISVFCLVASSNLWTEHSFQSRVISADVKADNQLSADVKAEKAVVKSYEAFVNQPTNIIGGSSTANSGTNIGNNATIVLDALPSQYDFPALATSIGKILSNGNLNVTSIGGTDEASSYPSSNGTADPAPVEIPFSFEISNASYLSVQNLFQTLQKSIRPIVIDNITLSGTDTSMDLSVNAHTFFQPEKVFKLGTETIN